MRRAMLTSLARSSPLRFSAPRPASRSLHRSFCAARAATSAETSASAAAAVGSTTANPVSETMAAVARRYGGMYMELSKARLSALVVASTSAGYFMAGTPISCTSLAAVTVGTSLAACSANTWNQLFEIRTDGLMKRTMVRARVLAGRIGVYKGRVGGYDRVITQTAVLHAASFLYTHATPLPRTHPLGLAQPCVVFVSIHTLRRPGTSVHLFPLVFPRESTLLSLTTHAHNATLSTHSVSTLSLSFSLNATLSTQLSQTHTFALLRSLAPTPSILLRHPSRPFTCNHTPSSF